MGRFNFKARSFIAALQGYNLVDVVVNFEDGEVEEEIDKFNNKNDVKLNNFDDLLNLNAFRFTIKTQQIRFGFRSLVTK